jgi:hypothetical protein
MPPSQFQCNICSKRFTRKENLEGHLRCHNSEKPFQCPKCNRIFGHASELSRHRKSHFEQRKYICSGFEEGGMRWGCEKQFTRLEGLKTHLSKSETGKICATQRINAQAGPPVASFHIISEQSSTSSSPPNQHEENILVPSATFASKESRLFGNLSIPGVQQQSPPTMSKPKDATMENATLASQPTTTLTSPSFDSSDPNIETLATPTRLTAFPWGIICDACKEPSTSTRYHCNLCKNGAYELCEQCFDWGFHCLDKKHSLVKLIMKMSVATISTVGEYRAGISMVARSSSTTPRSVPTHLDIARQITETSVPQKPQPPRTKPPPSISRCAVLESYLKKTGCRQCQIFKVDVSRK